MATRKNNPVKLPPLRALQAFESLARSGSVAAAAAELGVSSGAISQQLRKLEESVEMRLFERKGKGLELSFFGRLYQTELGPAFDQLRRAQEKLMHAKTSSGLVLSCLSSIATRWIGPQLFDWQAAHPEAKIRLTGAETEPRLTGEFVDFRISYGSAVRGFEHSAELFHDWAVPVCAPSLLHAHAVAEPSDLLRLPLINVEWDSSFGNAPNWKEWATSIGAASRHRATSELAYSLSSAAIDAAVHGRGVVLAQVSLIGDDLASGRLVAPFDHRVALDQPYFLAWDRAVLQKPHGPQFRSWLLAMGKRQAKASTGPLPVR